VAVVRGGRAGRTDAAGRTSVQASAAGALGELLRWHRQRRGLTQGELAARGAPELSVNTIGNLERGRTRPYRHTLETLCTALGLDEPERAAVFAAWRARARAAGPGPPPQTSAAPPAPPPPAAAASGALGLGRLGSFPASPASLVGREAEIRQICERLSGRESRLLTLTGPAGVGKTRLALAAAERLLGSLPDGGYFVDLSPIGEAALVLPTLARAVGAWDPGEPASPARVQARLGARQVLLVLDNFEHVLPAATPLAALLDACPRVRTLVTSREPLRLRREQQFPVPPLGLADSRGALTPAEVAAAPAAQLYVLRAQAVQPSFALTAANARAVAELCARLDGLPLAIELAAARIKVLPPGAILARLEGRLDLLASKGADEPARHRTLRAAIEWSHDLLDPGERALFRRLAVFAGAYTLEAAEAVCAEPPAPPGAAATRGRRRGRRRGPARAAARSSGLTVLAGLESLVDKSLLQREEAEGEPRFRMLETVRAFAQERLSEAGEAEPLARRHLEYCVRRAEQAVPHLLGAEQPRWLEHLGHEYDDLRAALGRAVAAGAAAPALRLAAALWRFWYFRSDFTEGRGWLTRVLALPATAAQAEARAEALNGAGALAISQDDFAAARSLYEECLALRRAAGDRSGEARALNNLSVVAIAVADYPRAQALLTSSLVLHRAAGYRIGEAYNLNNLGLLRRGEGALAAAQARQEESLALFEELGDVWGAAMAQCDLADVLRDRGAAEHAARLYEASLARRRAVGDRRGAGVTLAGLARLDTRRGRYAEARANLAAALAIVREVRDGRAAARVLETGAELAAAEARPEHALRLAAAAAAVRARAGVPLPRAECAPWEAWLRTVRGTVGEAEAVRDWAAGGATPLDQILTEALLRCSERPPGAGAMDALSEAVVGGWSAA
jgi:predicted ATPase